MPVHNLNRPLRGLRGDECLGVRTRDASWRCDLLDVLGGFLSCVASNRFRILTARPHVPRVQIDDLVIVRETWRASFEDLAFVMTENESELLMASAVLDVAGENESAAGSASSSQSDVTAAPE